MFRGRAERKVIEAGYDPARLPPGQYLTEKWPVLHAGSIPRTDRSTWDFFVAGEVENPIRLSWDEFNALPRTTHTQDIHCVTRWSKFDVTFEGVHWSALEPTVGEDELELLRIRAGTPRFGREIDDRVLPAEAGLDARAVDFEKGCYPGQEPIARQHYRGRVNRTLRLLELDGAELPGYDAELSHEGKVVGRITSAAPDGAVVAALGYVRVEVPRDAALSVGGRSATQLDFASPRP